MKSLFVVVWSLVLATTANSTPIYTITHVGGTTTVATALNASGQVTGYDTNSFDGFIYDGTMHDIGAFEGASSIASAINDSGHVTGHGGLIIHAFLYNGVNAQRSLQWGDLGTGTRGCCFSAGYGINNNDQITGLTFVQTQIIGGYYSQAFLFENGIMHDLGTLGGHTSSGDAINDNGAIVGASQLSGDFVTHAFLYENGIMHDLGTLGGKNSTALDINEDGQIVGQSEIGTDIYGNTIHHAFLYEDGIMHDLGTLGTGIAIASVAASINAHGQITGNSGTGAFLYDNGIMNTVNDLISLADPLNGLINFYDAPGINDRGQIIAMGYDGQGERGAYLLTPVATDVPEPTSMALVSVGLLGLTIARRTSKRAT